MYNRYQTRGLLDTNPAMAWIIIIVFLAIIVFVIAGMWKTFTKAGKPGWAAIVPFYNYYVLTEISGKPIWMAFILMFGGIIPVVGGIAVLVTMILVGMGVAEKFGKSQAFGVVALGLFGFVGYPILGFGDATYNGAAANTSDEILDDM